MARSRPRPRPRKHVMSTVDELKAVQSPVRHDLIAAMERLAPCSIRELAPALGLAPDRLYYHLRKLIKAGLLRRVGDQAAKTRREGVYDLVADHLVVDRQNDDPEFREALADMYDAALHVASQRVRNAIESAAESSGHLPNSLWVKRYQFRADRSGLATLTRRLDDLVNDLQSDEDRTTDKRNSLTVVLTPVE